MPDYRIIITPDAIRDLTELRDLICAQLAINGQQLIIREEVP